MNNIKDRLREIANERPYLRHGLIEVDRSLVHDAVDRIAELEGELARVREKYRIVREALVEGRTQAERNSALVLATVEPSALLAENGRLRKCIEELEAERDEWQSRAAQLARIGQATVKAIIDAHMKAFGPPRNYEYVDTQTTIDLLVADIGATQHERDRLIADNVALREALEAARPYLPTTEEDRRHSPDCTCQLCDKDRMVELVEAALTQPAPQALERVRREAKAEALSNIAARMRAKIQHAKELHIDIDPVSEFIETCETKAAELRGGE